MEKYDHKKIEEKWQKIWEDTKLYNAVTDSVLPKFYALIEFPYPSGEGLHVGHVRSNTAMDIIARKRRAEGFNVLYPIGWDAFGLPTENYAIKTGRQPAEITKVNTDTFRRQLKSIGFSFDWDREINTTDPAYYKWTQWIFLKLYEHGLAYKTKMPINWCLSCKIGLANEEVIDGACERCGGATEKREKEQWMLAITKYADRLDSDLDLVDYLPQVKIQQRNWIGRSEGAEISFHLNFKKNPADNDNRGPNGERAQLRVFTTRPDTLFGATYLVLAPEHLWVTLATDDTHDVLENKEEVKAYLASVKNRTEIERTAVGKEKTGVELKGVVVINPANEQEIPIFVADYVLGGYGTGAIMAVPAHDTRDFEFAQKFSMPIKTVIEPVFTDTSESGHVREELPYEHRDAIVAIVKHWSEDKYMGLKWKEVAWGTFITGGIEAGQTPEEAAIMEIRQETGYTNPKFVKSYGVFHSKFYHVPKKVNRFAHAHMLYFELADDSREGVVDEENSKHDMVWLTAAELSKFLTADAHQHALKLVMSDKALYTGEGWLVNSDDFTGMDSLEAKRAITEFVRGTIVTTYKLRDWVFSRQRYWGEPIPIIHCAKCGMVPVPESELPVLLPEVEHYTPSDSGESPLAAISEWVNVSCPTCGGAARRETDTMPNWAGSSWYYLRYADPRNDAEFASRVALDYFTPVDWYNGGMEHTTLHLLYSRFWHKFLFDQGLVPTSEPYAKRTSHGLILAEGGEKMSKSKGNVVNPDTVIGHVGADTLRLYEMFMGPFDQAIAWSTDNMVGSRRFLERVWNLRERVRGTELSLSAESLVHKTIKKVTEDIEDMKFNTAISALMILVNELERQSAVTQTHYSLLVRLLAPFAPHMTEEIWSDMDNSSSIHKEPWPRYDETKLRDEIITIAIQVNGKVRDTFVADPEITEAEVVKMALVRERVKPWILGKTVQKTIYVKNKLLSIVAT